LLDDGENKGNLMIKKKRKKKEKFMSKEKTPLPQVSNSHINSIDSWDKNFNSFFFLVSVIIGFR